MLEFNNMDFPDYNDIQELWQRRVWRGYIEEAPPAMRTMTCADWSLSYSASNSETDDPRLIENILVDLINFFRGHEEDEDRFNLNRIVECARLVLPRRAEMKEADYFNRATPEVRRRDILQQVIAGDAIF